MHKHKAQTKTNSQNQGNFKYVYSKEAGVKIGVNKNPQKNPF
jgi:hypothetical protein